MKSNFTEIYKKFRRELAAARRQKGLTQVDLAIRLDKPQSFVSKFENGQRRLDVVELIEIATALDLNAGELLTKVQEMIQKEQALAEAANNKAKSESS